MNNIEFDAFVTLVLRLVRTMVIKIEAVAVRDNTILQAAGYSVSSDKTTWRYYMNLNGDYHPTDEPMYVKSVDTGEMILFNKANLDIHLATFREYSSGGDLYQRLAGAYKGQSELIRGILAPIPFAETIPAENYKILKYNQNLVLWNEDQLIPRLQKWVAAETNQLFNNEYSITDDLMLPVLIGQLYGDLIKAIGTFRFEEIGTRHAHDFFIWSHIDSFGEFSRYKNSLTRTQIMWLYRNIHWLINNPGQQYAFDLMLENLLTPSDIPMARYDLVETTETQLDDLTPTPQYRRLMMNLQSDYGRAPAFIDTQQMIVKQQYLASDNYDQSSIYYEDALLKGRYSLHSEVPTKTLESSMKDYTNRHVDTLMTVVYNEWIYLAGKKLFNGKILVVDPKTGKTRRLPVQDAYYIWNYLIQLTKGEDPLVIEPAYYQNVMKIKPPSVQALVDIAGYSFLHPSVAKGIRDQWVVVDSFIAPEYLMSYSTQVYAAMWNHRKIFSQFYDVNVRARTKHATELMYESGVVNMSEYTSYKDLLKAYELDFSEYSADEARNFAWDIFKRITGWDSNSQPSLRAKQDDLIAIMMQLSSYTIQVVKEMDDGTAVLEMKNQTFIGDSRLTGPGHALYADTRNMRFGQRGRLDAIRQLTSVQKLPRPVKMSSVNNSVHRQRFPQTTRMKSVSLIPNLRGVARRLPNHSYFRLLDRPDTPVVPLELPPPTYYGELELWDEPVTEIPETYYGQLELEGPTPVPATRIPGTYYGELVIPDNALSVLDAVDYGTLTLKEEATTPGTPKFVLPVTNYKDV